MATSGTMASPIIIVDDDEIQSPELRISRLRRGPRRDYRYLDYERVLAESIDDTTGSTSSRKRRRTETKERSTLDDAFKKLRTTFDGEITMLRERNRMLRDELRLKRNEHQKGKEVLIQLREKLRCKICYEHPDRWATLACGHMFCLSCAENPENPKTPKKCPLCRAPVKGFLPCYPFAG
ncbi:uncharacterized protein N7458_005943 [Penicillium daleae]|uniref:RING-type domain-containing protein n=1 Tax=Penicillium daleae TaxID=63821 RepID=A0AAD6C3U6_9EURO|nr:uncharacterized protein N7458_005943 [Penicillium daleae]KAJ5449494.1 hypothetical protein N7458_005943 [Penicillium daleae]